MTQRFRFFINFKCKIRQFTKKVKFLFKTKNIFDGGRMLNFEDNICKKKIIEEMVQFISENYREVSYTNCRYLIYLYLGYDKKYISAKFNIQPASLRKVCQRLRKGLNLGVNEPFKEQLHDKFKNTELNYLKQLLQNIDK